MYYTVRVCATAKRKENHSKSKLHQPWIQDQWEQEMKCHDERQRPDGGEALDLPVVGYHVTQRSNARKDNHACDHDQAEDEGELEAAEDGGDLVEEGRTRCFLGCGAPTHIDGQHVRGDGLEDVKRDAAEEDGQEGQPGQIFDEGADKGATFDALRGKWSEYGCRSGMNKVGLT
jgi:hypothetical protein